MPGPGDRLRPPMSSRVLIGLLALPVAIAAQQPAPSLASAEAAFDTGLAAVHALMQKGKWNDARAALVELVKANANHVHVQAQCDAIASDLKTCAFYATAKTPKLAEMITGKIAAYDER